jgi:hypothetical protein
VIDGLECDYDALEWVGASDDLNHKASFLLHAVKSSLHTRVPEQFDRFKSYSIQQREMSSTVVVITTNNLKSIGILLRD